MQKLKIVLLISISCHASIVCMHRWLRDQNVRLSDEQEKRLKLTEELMNSREFDSGSVISLMKVTSKWLALARMLVRLQVVPLEEWEFQKKQMRREDLKNRMREVRSHMAEKRRKK
jgi:hypothetical protein